MSDTPVADGRHAERDADVAGWITDFDAIAERLLEPLRGTAWLDHTMTAATHAGEFSGIWHAIGLTRAIVTGRYDQTVALMVAIGAESLIVTQGVKRLFRRRRPTTGGDERFDIRTPLTSSFPSGHASAAAFAATILIGWDGRRSALLYVPIAAAIALSRPYVRIHHASDIVGGVATGLALAAAARPIIQLAAPARRRRA